MALELSEIREEINNIDEQLLKLFLQRMDCSAKVAAYKVEHNMPVYNAAREQEILDKISAKSGEYGDSARLLYSTIMNISRALQYPSVTKKSPFRQVIDKAIAAHFSPKTVGYQGSEGSYSQTVATKMFSDAKMQNFTHFRDVFEAVANGDIDCGIVPIENSYAGSVSENYDHLLQYDLKINAIFDLPVNHCLLVKPGADLSKIRTVYSHPQALAQCSVYLNEHGYEPSAMDNTAFAAEFVANSDDDSIAAIASEQAAQINGLTIAARGIQTSGKHNYTRFIAVSKEMAAPPEAELVSIAFSIPHEPGSLYKTLSMLAANGLNMTRIESRPDKESPFRYIFYVDFVGNIADEKTAALLCGLDNELPMLKLLGNCKIYK